MRDQKKHRVAIVVFMEAEGCDPHDASGAAQQALAYALYKEKWLNKDAAPLTLRTPPRKDGNDWEADVHHIMDAGIALGNGYLWAQPTSKAFPRREED